MRRTRVYVAGAYSADNVITVLDNMRKGMRMSTEVMNLGYAPFCPWLDYQFQLMQREDLGESLSVEDYYEYSLAWLDASDCVLVVPGYENSKGTMKELAYAAQMGLPIYYKVEDLYESENELRAETPEVTNR